LAAPARADQLSGPRVSAVVKTEHVVAAMTGRRERSSRAGLQAAILVARGLHPLPQPAAHCHVARMNYSIFREGSSFVRKYAREFKKTCGGSRGEPSRS
jgi:hypothetical protein